MATRTAGPAGLLLTVAGVLAIGWSLLGVLVQRIQPEAAVLSAGQLWGAVPAVVCVLIVIAWRGLLSQVDAGPVRVRASVLGAVVAVGVLGVEAWSSAIWGFGSGLVPGWVSVGVVLIALAPAVQDSSICLAARRDRP
ncbi:MULTISPECIES: hypothetical protein [unclassified Pseudoclavibacter]|uniref:hypothetical protein n=1 Tax=unclassified Pseudoclavibacter TaxID=2615177 RepID=UPI0011B0988D|nr:MULTISPECIES: hypothetical protein [unclassified Pseudoclavibacter]MBF4550354.1 hypothetical protein [Pseudoclavibacter sp. VKM Ac-2888]